MSRVCPVCSKSCTGHSAISRRDNKKDICPDCSIVEALEDLLYYMKEE